MDLFRKHRTGWRGYLVLRRSVRRGGGVKARWCSISGRTAAAKETAGWPAEGGGPGESVFVLKGLNRYL